MYVSSGALPRNRNRIRLCSSKRKGNITNKQRNVRYMECDVGIDSCGNIGRSKFGTLAGTIWGLIQSN